MSSAALEITADTPPAALLAHFAPHLKIAHQLPGRVRLKLSMKALDGINFRALESSADAFSAVLGQIRGVRGIKWNRQARSGPGEADTARLPEAAWPARRAGADSAAAQALHAILEETHASLRCAANA